MAALNPEAAAFDPGQKSPCFSAPGTTSTLSSREVGDGKASARYNLDGCFTNGALHTYTGRRTKSDPGPLATIYEEDELDELEVSIDECLNGEHVSRPSINDSEDMYEDEELGTCIDDCQNDEHHSSLAIDDADRFAPQLMYTAPVFVSEQSQQPWWPSCRESPESSVQYGPYYPNHEYNRYATPYDSAEGFPHSHLGYGNTDYPAPYDWFSYPAEGPSHVIGDNGFYGYAIPHNRYPFSIEGPAQFILDHSMYSLKYMDVGPDADSNGRCSFADYNGYDPAADGEYLKEERPCGLSDNFCHGVLDEDMANHSFRHAPEPYPVLPMWNPENTYDAHSADFETWTGHNLRDSKYGWGDDEYGWGDDEPRSRA